MGAVTNTAVPEGARDYSIIIDMKERRWLRRRVLAWFDEYGRSFPWRAADDPFEVLIAELLLQRTRADLVPEVFRVFLRRYPDAPALATADSADVVDVLRPLGFLHRSARLPALARVLVERFKGSVPRTEKELLSLPGVGRYVANAVLVVAFNKRRPLLDPNVIRLIGRVFGVSSSRRRARDDERLWAFLTELLPRRRSREFALGLIDLGAVVCVARRPRCFSCPLRDRCVALAGGRVTPAQPNDS
jgi:A/G-specific adenine glycosylase